MPKYSINAKAKNKSFHYEFDVKNSADAAQTAKKKYNEWKNNNKISTKKKKKKETKTPRN